MSQASARTLRAFDRELRGSLTLRLGDRAIIALLASPDEVLPVPPLVDIDTRIDRSDRDWRQWVDDLHCGASRYAWVRDAAYVIKTFLRVGALPDAQAGFSWLMTTIGRHRPGLAPCYTLRGGRVGKERCIDLPGYRNSQPVRVGNAAAEQLQTCAYGYVLEMASRMIDAGHILDPRTVRLLFELADECADNWMRKDSGFWELGDAQHYTMSKVECWMALRRACELAEAGQITTARLPGWQREKERILDWVDEHCWDETK